MDLNRLKMALGMKLDDTSKDAALEFILDDVKETILNYCNLKALPSGLTSTAYRMAVDLYRYEQMGSEGTPVRVSSISKGDTSTSFQNAADALSGGILKNYRVQLNRYRKLGH